MSSCCEADEYQSKKQTTWWSTKIVNKLKNVVLKFQSAKMDNDDLSFGTV